MVNIELTQQQAEELKNFYLSELEKIEKRADVIKELLKKFDTESVFLKVPDTVKEKVKKPAKEISLTDETSVKKPDWPGFVIQALNESAKPLSREAFTKLYEKQYNLKFRDPKAARAALEQALFKLRSKDKMIESVSVKGKKGKLYKLTEGAAGVTLTAKETKPETAAKPENAEPKIKYNWPRFIKDTLEKQKRVMCADELVKYAMHHFELTPDKKKTARGNISPTLTALRKGNILNFVEKEGQVAKSYGLINWFDSEGKLLEDYK